MGKFSTSSISEWTFKDRLVYKDPAKPFEGGTLYANASASNTTNPSFQLDKGRVPFGVQAYDEDPSKIVYKKNLEKDISTDAEREFFEGIDRRLIEYIVANSPTLMGKNMREEEVRYKYRSIVNVGNDSKYDPLVRLKVRVKTRNPDDLTKVMVVTNVNEYERTGNLQYRSGTIDEIKRGDEIMPVVEFSGIWFGQRISAQFSIKKLLLFPKTDGNDCDFDMGDVKMEEVAPPASVAAPQPVASAAADMSGETTPGSDEFAMTAEGDDEMDNW